MIVVVDTNVWISALAFGRADSIPKRVLKRVSDIDTLAMSKELREEIYRILTQTCGWSSEQASFQIDQFQHGAIYVRLRHAVHVCRDPKDDMFLECAALSNADVLVTGDKDLLSLENYGNTRIITPSEYVAMAA